MGPWLQNSIMMGIPVGEDKESNNPVEILKQWQLFWKNNYATLNIYLYCNKSVAMSGTLRCYSGTVTGEAVMVNLSLQRSRAPYVRTKGKIL